jgi:hypothetical protein
MYDFDTCPDCIDHGICPRCGKQAWDHDGNDDGESPCPHCQWDPKNPDSCPPEPECGCWMDDIPFWENYGWDDGGGVVR